MKKLFITLLSLSIVTTALQASVLWTGATSTSLTVNGNYSPAYQPNNASNTDGIGYYTGFLADGTTPVTNYPLITAGGPTWGATIKLYVTGGRIDLADGMSVTSGSSIWNINGGIFGYPATSIVTDNRFAIGAGNTMNISGGVLSEFCELRLQGILNISSGAVSTTKGISTRVGSENSFIVYTADAQVNMTGGLLSVPAYSMVITSNGTAKTVMKGGSLTAGTFALGNANTARISILEFGLGNSTVTATNTAVPANTFVTNGVSNYIDFVNTTYSFDLEDGWIVTAGSGGVLTIYGWAEGDYQTKLWATKNLYINGIEASTQPGWNFGEFFTVVDAGGTHPAGTYSLKLNVVPEPTAWVLLGVSLLVVTVLRKRK